MQTITEKTVREIATEDPSSVRVFEALGIDYCCGGKRPLSDACARANTGVDRVLQLLAEAHRDSRAPVAGGWSEKPLRHLTAHIVQNHHGFVRREMPRIASLLS